jgi:hypothetical protein
MAAKNLVCFAISYFLPLNAETRCSLASKRWAGNPLFFDILTTAVRPILFWVFGIIPVSGSRPFFGVPLLKQTQRLPKDISKDRAERLPGIEFAATP